MIFDHMGMAVIDPAFVIGPDGHNLEAVCHTPED